MIAKLKFIIIPYIALGFVLSLAIGIEYKCTGQEMFPDYYGSPFVFKKKSLGSSMTYFYSVFGLISNVIVWCIFLVGLNQLIQTLIKQTGEIKFIKIFYKGVIGLLIIFTTLNIFIDSILIGHGFEKGLNYWYMDMEKEAEIWGMDCKGELVIFKR